MPGGDDLKLILRIFRRLEDAGALIAALCVFAVMALGLAEIVGRTVFNRPIHGHVDLITQAMPLIVFLGISSGLRSDSHVRMTLVLDALSRAARLLVEALVCIAGGFISIVLAIGAFQNFQRALKFNDTTPDIHILTWPIKLVVAFCLLLLGLRFLIYAFGYFRQWSGVKVEPDGDLIPELNANHVPGSE